MWQKICLPSFITCRRAQDQNESVSPRHLRAPVKTKLGPIVAIDKKFCTLDYSATFPNTSKLVAISSVGDSPNPNGTHAKPHVTSLYLSRFIRPFLAVAHILHILQPTGPDGVNRSERKMAQSGLGQSSAIRGSVDTKLHFGGLNFNNLRLLYCSPIPYLKLRHKYSRKTFQ